MTSSFKQDELELFTYWRSSASWRCRISLYWKSKEHFYLTKYLDIPFKSISINLVKGQQNEKDYVQNVNHNATVPSLAITSSKMEGQAGRFIISQSTAILEFLEESGHLLSHDGTECRKLLPDSPFDRARVRSIMMLIGCDIHPIQNLRVLNKIGDTASTEGGEKRKEWAVYWISNGFNGMHL